MLIRWKWIFCHLSFASSTTHSSISTCRKWLRLLHERDFPSDNPPKWRNKFQHGKLFGLFCLWTFWLIKLTYQGICSRSANRNKRCKSKAMCRHDSPFRGRPCRRVRLTRVENKAKIYSISSSNPWNENWANWGSDDGDRGVWLRVVGSGW